MYGEALNSYNVIVKNKLFSNAGTVDGMLEVIGDLKVIGDNSLCLEQPGAVTYTRRPGSWD